MTDTPELPPLPEPDGVIVVGTQAMRAFTAETVQRLMRAYAAEAVDSEWLSVECRTLEHAVSVEARFHAAGWVARVVAVRPVVSYPTAGAGR